MLVIENENIIHLDIDDTLILHTEKLKLNNELREFLNPYTNVIFTAGVSKKHVDLLRNYKARGFYLIAHSGNGWKYTQSIIEQLGLDDIIDLVHTKNSRYVDDLPCEEWMGNRIYLEEQ